MKNIKAFPLIVSILLPLAAGFIGSIFTIPSIPTWYAGLQKPFFNPPNWVFGPVWTFLYISMGISFYQIWQKKAEKHVKKNALRFFFAQLVFNVLWSIVFFGFHAPLLGFITIVVLWILIFFTIRKFLLISKSAGYLLIPYLGWVSFASLLNLFIVILNR